MLFEKDLDFIISTGDHNAFVSLNDILSLVKSMRRMLENKSYLLDHYLSLMLETANTTLIFDAATKGFEAGSDLRRICTNIVTGRTEKFEHPFYEKAEKYIGEHPLDFQEHVTKIDLYFSSLSDEYLRDVLEKFIEKQTEKFRAVVDTIYLKELYNRIAEVTGKEVMDALNDILRRRFLNITLASAFIQGFTNDLLYCLAHRDCETNKQVFQIM
jgi:hypothetical protein